MDKARLPRDCLEGRIRSSLLCVSPDPALAPHFPWSSRYSDSAAPVSAHPASSECSRGNGVRHEGEGGALCDKIFRRIRPYLPHDDLFEALLPSAVVDLSTVGDPEDQDDEAVVLDCVDDSVVPDSYTPASPFTASKHRGAWRARFDAEKFDGTGDAKPMESVELLKGLRGGRGEFNGECHPMPRSALISDHGTVGAPAMISAIV